MKQQILLYDYIVKVKKKKVILIFEEYIKYCWAILYIKQILLLYFF